MSLQNKKSPKVSVIIPVYRAEKYIIECIDSLLNQTLKDIEVIVVDDHGDDNSISLIKEYIKNHERKEIFRFIATKTNSGPGIARNAGLEIAEGEYIAFLDSDDKASPSMYEELYNMAKLQSADICYCHIQQVDVTGKSIGILRNQQTSQGIFTQKEKRHLLVNFVAYLWSYIYRRDFLQTNFILFPPEKSSEDSYFLTCCLMCAKRIAYVDKYLYHYRHIENSLSHRKNDKRYLDKLSVFKRLFQFEVERGLTDYSDELQFIYLKKAYILGCIEYLKNTSHPQINILKDIYRDLLTTIPNYRQNRYYKSSIKARTLVVFLKHMPYMTIVIFQILIKIIEKKRKNNST